MSEYSSLIIDKPLQDNYEKDQERKLTHIIVFILCLKSEGYFLKGTDFTPIPVLILRIITVQSDDRTAKYRLESLTTDRQSSLHGVEDRAPRRPLACHQCDSTGGKSPILGFFH